MDVRHGVKYIEMYLNTNTNTFLFGQIQILSFVKYLNTNTNTLESISNTNTFQMKGKNLLCFLFLF